MQRYDAFNSCVPAQNGTGDLSMWLHLGPLELHPLRKYSWRSLRPIAMGKNIVKAENMAAYEVCACTGTLQQQGTDEVCAHELFTATMRYPCVTLAFRKTDG